MLTAMTAADPADRPDAARCVTLLRALEAGQTGLPMAVRRSTRRVLARVLPRPRSLVGRGAAALGSTHRRRTRAAR